MKKLLMISERVFPHYLGSRKLREHPVPPIAHRLIVVDKGINEGISCSNILLVIAPFGHCSALDRSQNRGAERIGTHSLNTCLHILGAKKKRNFSGLLSRLGGWGSIIIITIDEHQLSSRIQNHQSGPSALCTIRFRIGPHDL